MKKIKNLTAEQLCKSILQLAIQGKLVSQNAEDGNAKDLLAEIKKEKAKLIKEGKIKKEKPLPEITDKEKPFEIPENWCWCRLKDIGTWQSGSTPDRSRNDYYSSNDVPWICSGDLTDDFIKETHYISKKAFDEKNTRLNKAGSVCIAMYGATIGKLGILTMDSTTNQAVCVCNNLIGVEAKFLFYFLKNHKDEYIKSAFGGAQPNISKEKIEPTLFPLPPLAEQKRIVEKIESLEPLLKEYEKHEKVLTELDDSFVEKCKKSILQYAIEGKLLPQNPTDEPASELVSKIRAERDSLIKQGKLKKDKNESYIYKDEDGLYYEKIGKAEPVALKDLPFEIPEGWVWVRLKSICDVKGGKRIPVGHTYSPIKTEYKYLRVADMKNNSIIGCAYIDDKIFNQIKNYTIKKGDIYITVAGTIGDIGIIPDEYDGANLTENADKLLLNDKINKMFILKCLTSNFCQESIKDVTTKVGQPKLAIKKIEDLLIPLPPLAEQKRIVAKIEQIFDGLAKIEK